MPSTYVPRSAHAGLLVAVKMAEVSVLPARLAIVAFRTLAWNAEDLTKVEKSRGKFTMEVKGAIVY